MLKYIWVCYILLFVIRKKYYECRIMRMREVNLEIWKNILLIYNSYKLGFINIKYCFLFKEKNS